MALAASVIGRSIFYEPFLCFITVLLQTEEPWGFVLDAEAAYFLAGNLTRNKITEVLQGSREADYNFRFKRNIKIKIKKNENFTQSILRIISLFLYPSLSPCRPEPGGSGRWRSRLPPPAHRLHQHAAAGVGEGVPLQQVPVQVIN